MRTPRIHIGLWKRMRYGRYQWLDHWLGRKTAFKLTNRRRRNFYKKLEAKSMKLRKGELIPVDRVKDLDLNEFVAKYVKTGRPVVLEGAAKEWACVKNWSLDYFKDLHGDDEIVLVDQHTMDLGYKNTSLREVIEGIQEDAGKYYRFYPLLERHPEHFMDFDVEWLRKFKRGYSPTESFQVFIGGDKSYTPLHNASLANLFIQVVGEKEWILYPNKHIAVVDPDPVRNIYRHAPIRKDDQSFNAFEPDFSHPFNLYEQLDGFKVHLKPGDVFYNPPYYWHTVRNIGDSIGVGYRWLPLFQNMRKEPLYTLMDLTARKPSFWKTLKYLKQDVNLLHLAETGELKDYLKKQEGAKRD